MFNRTISDNLNFRYICTLGNIMKKNVQQFNDILDLCRRTPKKRADIIRALSLNPDRATNAIKLLVDRGMLVYESISTDKRVLREYKTVGGSVYKPSDHRTTNPARRKVNVEPQQVVPLPKNVVRVTSNDYHTKGSPLKRSAWVASTTGGLI